MPDSCNQRSVPRVPDGYTTIPLDGDRGESPLRIGILVRRVAEPVAGHLVPLREGLDSRTFLGCILDASDRVLGWLDIRVQTMAGLCGAAAVYRDAMSNSLLDRRWRDHADALDALDTVGMVRTGWESVHPRPSFLDVAHGGVLYPEDAGGTWRLCEDDALLEANGLPPYGASHHRYIASADTATGNVRFVPVTPDAPTNDRTVAWEAVLPNHADLVPFNPEGGLILVGTHAAMGLDEYLAVLGGKQWLGVQHGGTTLDTEGFGRTLGSPDMPDRMFLSRRGRGGRLVESLYLRLRAFVDILGGARSMVARLQRPLLNISDESFRVQFAGTGSALPLPWTARVELVDPGDAVELRVGSSNVVHYVRPEPHLSVFRPASEGLPLSGRGELRIRQVMDSGAAGSIVEGTFRAQEDVRVAPHDLIWLRVGLAHGAVDLYGRAEEDRALARGEWRFRSVEQEWSAADKADVKAAEGVSLPNVPFEVMPLVTTPSDLYALAVVGVRMLLVNDDTTLPVALDELISLAREAAASGAERAGLSACLSTLFAGDPRWAASLGPQRLAGQTITAEDAFRAVPAALWMDVISLLVGMLPGMGRFSYCSGYGAAAPGGLELVFEEPLKRAGDLLLATRSLIVTDWDENREIRALITGRLAGYGGGEEP